MAVQLTLTGTLSSEEGSRQKASQDGPLIALLATQTQVLKNLHISALETRGSSFPGPAPCSALC